MESREFETVVDGERVASRVVSVQGQPDRVTPSDVLMVPGMPPIVVGDRNGMDLRDTGRESGLVFEEGQAGPVACRIGDFWTDPGDDEVEAGRVFVNPLAEMSADEARAIRGVEISGWEPGIESDLRKIDWAHCALSINTTVIKSNDGCIPTLPDQVRYLVVELGSWRSDDKFDSSSLSGFAELRVLVLPGLFFEVDIESLSRGDGLCVLHVTDARLHNASRLPAFPHLRDLDLSGCKLEDHAELDVVGNLRQLRRLNLSKCTGLESVEFARHLDALEYLDISRTKVSDLTCLQDLRRIERIIAVKTPLASLPERGMSNLGYLNILSSGVDKAAVESFRQAHLSTRIRHGWAQSLRDELEGTDRVHVRSGGTCHRNVHEETTFVEESDVAAIEQLLRSIDINEPKSGGHCMCCGNPTIEFYRGDELLAEIGLHHGMSARWKGWPEDAVLSLTFRNRLSAWLAERGEKSFSEDHLETQAREMGEDALVDDCLELLPPACSELWTAGSSGDSPFSFLKSLGDDSSSVVTASGPSVVGANSRSDYQKIVLAIEEEVQDPVEAVALAFRLLGCGEGSWNQIPGDGLHRTALALLEQAAASVRGAALKRVIGDDTGLEGVTRWLLYHGGLDTVPAEVFDDCTLEVFQHGLTHPRIFNRRHTLAILGTGEGPFVLEMLRTVLHGLPQRIADPRHATEPGGWVVRRGGEQLVPEGTSDAAAAAKLLAELGDTESYRTICELAETADEPSRSVLCEAKDVLERLPASN